MKYIAINKIKIKLFVVLFIAICFYIIIMYGLNIKNILLNIDKLKNEFDIDFDYIHYENDIITDKMIKESGWLMNLNEAYLINGLIRKYKPKNCLEIGVAMGGSAILILNAIKDYPDSKLISIDLFSQTNQNKKIGYLVEEKFPELMNKWQLFTGDMPHKFLSKLNLKFDFFFLDSAHIKPGEFFNLIEALPFLNENAIIVLHDIEWHLLKAVQRDLKKFNNRIMPTQIYLMSSLVGKKILIKQKFNSFLNIGVVCLSKNQKKYYLNYFLLLLTIWQYRPTKIQLNDLREFIKNYYEDKLLLKIFDNSVDFNNRIFDNLNMTE